MRYHMMLFSVLFATPNSSRLHSSMCLVEEPHPTIQRLTPMSRQGGASLKLMGLCEKLAPATMCVSVQKSSESRACMHAHGFCRGISLYRCLCCSSSRGHTGDSCAKVNPLQKLCIRQK